MRRIILAFLVLISILVLVACAPPQDSESNVLAELVVVDVQDTQPAEEPVETEPAPSPETFADLQTPEDTFDALEKAAADLE
ncbi:MAG: hypothetical protein QF632_06415 [Candidatus Woesearchaeota archaeon]|jgi:hypothetical protein|nr:hypothetical protein [Candidatus Woesearchaeota archaeon]MDP7324368.1 hypothetical protein [Candidatus Woesearchaeota archaeon]MDP7457806.1 hypothetical protein [Candidatus Woesearchaeota archaeon]|tara:strand:- start:600 stop:845 length:246 start_codon:yes stop_codon:yes gene_type:complete